MNLTKKKEEKIDIEEAYMLYKEEAGEEIEQIELKKSFLQKQKEKVEEQADIRRRIKQEQQYSNTDKKLEKMRLECESIKHRQQSTPNYMPSKAERNKLLAYANAERRAKLKKQEDEKKELARKAKRMKRRRNALSTVPKSVQETIPYIADYEEGIFEISEGVFSKTFQLRDINYQVSKEEEQIAIFCKYGEFINYFSEDMLLNITIVNRKVNQETQEDEITFRMREDGLDEHRKEYNKILLRQLASGKNDMVQTKYATVTLNANNPFEAVLKFHKTQNEVCGNLKKIGSNGKALSTDERLSLLHDILRPKDVGLFKIDYDFIKKQGISSKDYIAPASFYFDRDYFMIDDKYYRVLFLNNIPASLSDDFLAKITDVDFPSITNMMIRPVEQAKGLKIVSKKIAGMESEKIDYEKNAIRSGYNPETISHDLKQSLYEGKELQDDMINKNQKMFLTALTIMVGGADSLDELNQNCEILCNKARQYTCTFQTLNYQQEEGFAQSLLLGQQTLYVDRTLTTESLSIFIPFTSNELFEPGGFYYGLNQISKNLLLFNRNNMKAPHGFVLGSTGSGKSFATKREMLNVILNMSEDEADMIVIDPDNEYTGFISAFGEQAEIINIASDSPNHINPMELSKNYSDEDKDPITMKSQFILSLVESMMSVGNSQHYETIITPPQRTLVDRALRRAYAPLLEHDFDNAYQPTLIDFQRELDYEKRYSEDGRIVAEATEYYTKGSMNVFAHHSNVNLNKRLIVFNTKDLGGALKQIGLMIVLDFIWNRMVQNANRDKHTYLYIDEVHTLFTNEFSADFLRQLFKRGRKYGLIITAITQDVEELLQNEAARKMISNSNYILMLNQSSENLEILSGMLKLSDTQQGYVSMADEGCGLLFADKVIVPFEDHFPEDSYLYKLMSTKFGEKFDSDEDSQLSEEDAKILKRHFKFNSLNSTENGTHGEKEENATLDESVSEGDVEEPNVVMEMEMVLSDTNIPEEVTELQEESAVSTHGEKEKNATLDESVSEGDVEEPNVVMEMEMVLSDTDIPEEVIELQEESVVSTHGEEKETNNVISEENGITDLADSEEEVKGEVEAELDVFIENLSDEEKKKLRMRLLDKLLEE